MDKKWVITVIIVIVIGLLVGVGTAIFSSYMNKTDNTNIVSQKELANTNIENSNIDVNNVKETSSSENIISPNAIIVKKTYYKKCDHLIKEEEPISEDLINKTEEDVKNKYLDWQVTSFTNTQITLYKELDEQCDEHYFVQEKNGIVVIYTIDKSGTKTLKQQTEILTKYLPDEDVEKIKDGVEIIGYTKLVEFLEDFE